MTHHATSPRPASEPAPTLELGGITIDWLRGGNNQLDGGTMFGAVPKLLWNKRYPADSDNYIELLNHPLLIRTPEANLLIDTGLGNKLSKKQEKIFRVTRPWEVIEDLHRFGLGREDIDYVLFSHGDFDHAGGVVMVNPSGDLELTYPRARHLMQRREWEDISAPNSRAAHTYFPVNFEGLEASGLLELVDGEAEVVPGVTLRHSGGHTRGHQVVMIEGDQASALHMGDLFPTHHHANPLWIMAYDNFPLRVIEEKEALFGECLRKNCWLTFYHDFQMRACRLGANQEVVETFG
ncbi:MBL fold metallo-hydrolase [Desulfogranum mediterraneum]|uniref:MBL fold metallo-hydrolase n=1 Tax=Desulfogranum mediterraneum TaxID=160661 RepID=UPI00041AC7F3|nr:MBL fold metallo-hydrolase [Desulfogranum mediterraneum]